MKTKGKIAAIGVSAAIATGIGIGLSVDNKVDNQSVSESVSERQRSSESHKGIETSNIFGVIQGYSPMMFVKERYWDTNKTDRLEILVTRGTNLIYSCNGLSSPPANTTLAFLACTTNSSGWNSAYPTSADKLAATNSLASRLNVLTYGVDGVPDVCEKTLGWLCFLPNGFWSGKTSPVAFSEVKDYKGCWLMR